MLPSDWKKHERVITSNLFPNSQVGCVETHRQESNEKAEFLLPITLADSLATQKAKKWTGMMLAYFVQNNPLPMRTSWWNQHTFNICLVIYGNEMSLLFIIFPEGGICPNMHLWTNTAFSRKSTAGGYCFFFCFSLLLFTDVGPIFQCAMT